MPQEVKHNKLTAEIHRTFLNLHFLIKPAIVSDTNLLSYKYVRKKKKRFL